MVNVDKVFRDLLQTGKEIGLELVEKVGIKMLFFKAMKHSENSVCVDIKDPEIQYERSDW